MRVRGLDLRTGVVLCLWLGFGRYLTRLPGVAVAGGLRLAVVFGRERLAPVVTKFGYMCSRLDSRGPVSRKKW